MPGQRLGDGRDHPDRGTDDGTPDGDEPVPIPSPALVVLIGASGSGKSTWARRCAAPSTVVSSDELRGRVGESIHDQKAGADAFEVLELIVERRARRRLTTVIDTLGLDPERRARWVQLGRKHRLTTVAVVLETPAKICRARNRERDRPVPAKVLAAQLAKVAAQRASVHAEGFDLVLENAPGRIAPAAFATTAHLRPSQESNPVTLRFGLQLPAFDFADREQLGSALADLATTAERVGFESIWVMDHFRQIPQMGRAWDPMLESWTTLGFLANATERARLGTMVTGVTYRNLGHLAKLAATADVLSGGRVVAGLGAAWFEAEHRAYGWEFPPTGRRLDLLEDALQALPLLWGPGSPPFDGRVVSLPETMCYPRPIQESIPLLVGGGGERRTLALVAKYADACNLFGEPERVAKKLAVLDRHCEVAGRDRSDIEVTQLGSIIVAADDGELGRLVDRIRPPQQSAERYASTTNAGTADDHVGRFRALADVGVDTAIVSLGDLGDRGEPSADKIERFAPVINAFADGAPADLESHGPRG